MPNLVTLHRNPDRYTGDPNIFDPTRFLDDDTDAYTSALSASYMERDHFHYGFGRRLCQGIHFTENSLFIAISRILWGFDIKPVPGAQPLRMAHKICEFSFRAVLYITSYTLKRFSFLSICSPLPSLPLPSFYLSNSLYPIQSLSHTFILLSSPSFLTATTSLVGRARP